MPPLCQEIWNPEHALAGLAVLCSIRSTNTDQILAITNVLNIQAVPPKWGSVSELHSAAILALGSFGMKGEGATKLLMRNLTSTNAIVRAASATALARVQGEPQRVVPLILDEVTALASPVRKASMAAPPKPRSFSDERNLALYLWALGGYGRHAREALPILSNLKSYPLGNIQSLAWNTATKIKSDTNSVAP